MSQGWTHYVTYWAIYNPASFGLLALGMLLLGLSILGVVAEWFHGRKK